MLRIIYARDGAANCKRVRHLDHCLVYQHRQILLVLSHGLLRCLRMCTSVTNSANEHRVLRMTQNKLPVHFNLELQRLQGQSGVYRRNIHRQTLHDAQSTASW